MTARDVMYGRRGGGWVAKPRTRAGSKAKPGPAKKPAELHRCVSCGDILIGLDRLKELPERPVCPDSLPCWARAFWTDDEWEGRARMAAARRSAARAPMLDELDTEALVRHPQPWELAA